MRHSTSVFAPFFRRLRHYAVHSAYLASRNSVRKRSCLFILGCEAPVYLARRHDIDKSALVRLAYHAAQYKQIVPCYNTDRNSLRRTGIAAAGAAEIIKAVNAALAQSSRHPLTLGGDDSYGDTVLLRIKAIHSFAFGVNSDQAVQRKLYSEAQPGCRNYYSVQNESYSADRFAGPLSDIKNSRIFLSAAR